MPQARPLIQALFVLVAGCDPGPGSPLLPRIANEEGLDPVLLDHIHEAQAACERGEQGSWLELAQVYEANDLSWLAAQTYEACLALDPAAVGTDESTLHFHRGRALADSGRAPEALRAFDQALALQDDYAPMRWRRGLLLLDAGRVAEARADFERALALEPDSVPANLALARALLVLDEPERARDLLLSILERVPDERFVHGLLARTKLALGDEAGAEAELRLEEGSVTNTVADPLTADMRKRATGILNGVRRANDALRADKPKEALKVLRPLYQRVPEDLAVLQMMGKALVAAGEHERAIEVMRRGSELHPEDGKLELFLGLALKAQGASEEARTHLQRSCTLDPDFPPALVALGEVELALGRAAEAEEHLARAIELGDKDLSTRVALGQAQMNQAAWSRAVATFERARRESPDAVAAWTYLAEAQARAGDVPAAEVSLAEATRLGPNFKRIAGVRRLLDERGVERGVEHGAAPR